MNVFYVWFTYNDKETPNPQHSTSLAAQGILVYQGADTHVALMTIFSQDIRHDCIKYKASQQPTEDRKTRSQSKLEL